MSLRDLLYEITMASVEKDLAKARARAVAAIERYFVEKGEYRIAEEWKTLWEKAV